MAEIVHDVAPAAQLYLICAATTTELSEAKDWLVGHGIRIDDSLEAKAAGAVSRQGRTVARFQGERAANGKVRSFGWRPHARGRYLVRPGKRSSRQPQPERLRNRAREVARASRECA